jgi:hypothetical protein
VTAVLWALVVLNLALTIRLLAWTGSVARLAAPPPDLWAPELEVGTAAPTFRAKRVNGSRVTQADFPGPTAYVFLSPNCESCRDTLRKLQPFVPAARAHGTAVVVVTDTGAKQTSAWLDDAGGSATPVLVAPLRHSALVTSYDGPAFFPYFVLVDAGGTVAARGIVGRVDWVTLTATWAAAAKARPAPVPGSAPAVGSVPVSGSVPAVGSAPAAGSAAVAGGGPVAGSGPAGGGGPAGGRG